MSAKKSCAKRIRELIACFIFVMVALLGGTNMVVAAPPAAGPAMLTVPAGKGLIGCNEAVDSECEEDEKPGRVVETAAFEIDVTEVTVAQYRACVDSGTCSAQGLELPSSGTADEPDLAWTCNWGNPDRDRHPINCISWEAAGAFCKWANKRLPTATEWERAARGTDGRRYPWGNEAVKPSPQANLSDKTLLDSKPGGWGLNEFVDGFVSTAPVGSFPAGDSPVGAKDMAGNVWELVTDGNETRHEMRGGAWSYYPIALRVSDKAYAPNGRRNGDTGFRCVR
jgi:formylglycine-generating enzyme required for sulfatase activity